MAVRKDGDVFVFEEEQQQKKKNSQQILSQTPLEGQQYSRETKQGFAHFTFALVGRYGSGGASVARQ